ncbi:MAG: hypothetical protein II663_00945, partial [Bacteroidales bacterium]|nr:hypothetical protein [Bacteroidales bacterium]
MTTQVSKVVKPQNQSDDFVAIKDFLALCLSRWYWFVISLVLALSIAVIHILRTPNIYSRSAELLIKEENNKGRIYDKAFQNAAEEMGAGIMKSKIEICKFIYSTVTMGSFTR